MIDNEGHPLIARLVEIFGEPRRPSVITEIQFDFDQEELWKLLRAPWGETKQHEFFGYLDDLRFEELQPDLFTYLFPSLLITLWRGMADRSGGPQKFYGSVTDGGVLERMLDERERNAVLTWMVDAFIDAIDNPTAGTSAERHMPDERECSMSLSIFNALGCSFAITDRIWDQLCDVKTAGRGQWWTAFGAGLMGTDVPSAWRGRVQMAKIRLYDLDSLQIEPAFLPANHAFMRRKVTLDHVHKLLAAAEPVLATSAFGPVLAEVRQKILAERQSAKAAIEEYIQRLGIQDLGEPSWRRMK
ncbi:MAG: hypothetical protein M9921_09395 [Fimbriimonadaceae bacterium]|nr:hypothetical protein [Fimbriimonadaceae bacterium]